MTTTDAEDGRLTAADMDAQRKENIAYEYLCHLEEAKVWMEACINQELPPTTEIEECLRNGVALAKLGHFINPSLVPMKKIFDRDETKYKSHGLHFRHTDNINHWLRGLDDVGLSKSFWPETTDIYDRKNMPKVIYCIHALSLFLFKLGRAPQIQDLYGKIQFTEEEISAMRSELEKYGIQMPAFSKIGGILANEMPVDEAALHAAVIAINEAIEQGDAEMTEAALHNPAAHLVNVLPALADQYQARLHHAKESKAEVARNKSARLYYTHLTTSTAHIWQLQSLDPDSSYVPDVYDELLTQAELQGNINMTNTQYAIGQLHAALTQHDVAALLCALRKPQLNLRDVRDDCADLYMTSLLQAHHDKQERSWVDDGDDTMDEEPQLTRKDIQSAVHQANSQAENSSLEQAAFDAINRALDGEDSEATMRALSAPHAALPALDHYGGALYHEELRAMKADKQADLDHSDLTSALTVLSALAQINKAIDTRNPQLTYEALTCSSAHLAMIDNGYKDKYFKQLAVVKNSKRQQNGGCEFVTHEEIQGSIYAVNQRVCSENERIEAVSGINEAVDSGDCDQTLAALLLPAACVTDVETQTAAHYHALLAHVKLEKAQETDDSSAQLWCEEIQNTVNLANEHAHEARQLSLGVAAINVAMDTEMPSALLTCLQNRAVGLHCVSGECAATYLRRLIEMRNRKVHAGEGGSGWMMNRTRDGYRFYFNVHSHEEAWERPANIRKDYSLLTRDEIQECVSDVTAAYDRHVLFKSNELMIVRLQALIRGFLTRRRVHQQHRLRLTLVPAATTIQAWWRMVLARRAYLARLHHLYCIEGDVIKLQSAVRMFLAREKYHRRLQYFKNNEDSVIKIQAFMRSNWAQQDYKALMQGGCPSLSVVRRFVHMLDIGDLDYDEEIEVERLRQQVVTDIRSNKNLEIDLNAMDIKIGLLVKNRITLQDVLSQHKTLKKYRESSSTLTRGLKALSKASRVQLEAYQHLFYLLQTNPFYLARLIFEMPQSRTTRFMESVILTLYNYASNAREEYLLLNLFKNALQEEVLSKVDKMSDIVTGNPMVIKMIVSFNRNSRGLGCLRELLQPLVLKVIDDKHLVINTNPVEVYKQWVNSTETQTGQTSGLPYEVTLEQALSHEEVRSRINQSVQTLTSVTESFLSTIFANIHTIPYGMRCMAKVLRDTLTTKFSTVPEKDVLKIVGNLIYYRYINSAIVAPDAFDIIDVGPNRVLTNDQRRNLGSVAKILQFAASNKGFGGDSAHLAGMNKYIMEAHLRFKQYFRDICDVEEPEVHFKIDQYTDVTRVTKPVIYISIAEIIDTHKLLCEHADTIAPDRNDPLHELMADLGDVPDVEGLIGETCEDGAGPSKAQLARTEISLTLANKFEIPEDSQSDMKSLLLRTKRLVVELIRCQKSGDSLVDILNTPARQSEESEHQSLIKKRERIDLKASRRSRLVRQASSVSDMKLPLESIKQRVIGQLRQLEQLGVVHRRDGYQLLVNSVVQDIRSQRHYRQRRRQEVVGLRYTLKSLAAKRAFFEEQINYYSKYVKTCLDNLNTRARKSSKKLLGSQKSKASIKYSAAQLAEKGVMLEIEGLTHNQFKNVLFEISATDAPDVFDVNAKFMGVALEKVELVFSDLLQLQYEGVAVMRMFDRAKVNVNLLVFLINKKFYGK